MRSKTFCTAILTVAALGGAAGCASEAESGPARRALSGAARGPTTPTGALDSAGSFTPAAGRDGCVHHGDVNADSQISADDALRAFRIAIGLDTPTPEQACAADCTNDGLVSAGDALEIFRFALGASHCPQNLADGEACALGLECLSGHCQNGRCCAGGDCCITAAECAPGYGSAPVCDEPATCSGSRSDPICAGFVCAASDPIPDESGCASYPECVDCPEPTAPLCIARMLAYHNQARANVDPPAASPIPALTWDGIAAEVAGNWAGGCAWGHNPNRTSQYRALGGQANYVGENIFAASGYPLPLDDDAALAWLAEEADWTYAPVGQGDCASGGVCGHYTQMIWANTRRVGCGARFCPTVTGLPGWSNVWIVVCNYVEGGNYIGQYPYLD